MRAAVVRALEALEDGDQAGAALILLAALEGEGAEPPACVTCGQRAWPGDLSRHIWSAHRAAELAEAA